MKTTIFRGELPLVPLLNVLLVFHGAAVAAFCGRAKSLRRAEGGVARKRATEDDTSHHHHLDGGEGPRAQGMHPRTIP